MVFHFFKINTNNLSFWYNDKWIILGVVLVFIREFSSHKINFSRTIFNPAQLFIISFITIIILGTFMLMLPKATYNGISFLDALFTSTSAVCVTGLIVVDTSSYFTPLGHFFIMMLIQIGGIGILTVASYLSYFFKGKTTFENELVLSDITNTNKLGEVFSTLKNVIIITFTIETVSAVLIYLSIHNLPVYKIHDKIFFSIFHSISAFCNAGFSTLSQNLYELGFRNNYTLQIIIMLTFIFGGLGFPIMSNIVTYIKSKLILISPFSHKKYIHKPWILTLNSRVTLITTLTLILGGSIFFYFLEHDHAFASYSGSGKIIQAMFAATSPRTAGFNTVDMSSFHLSTIMITFLLMWIGASSASTGGGIKTGTFAILVLNILSLARGKEKIEIFRRTVSNITIQRAFAVVGLSFFVIGAGVILISIFNENIPMTKIAFECFSAYSTVGLSLGITAELSSASKIVIILIMFIGRVSMLTIMIAFFKKVKFKSYSYPKDEILIN